MSSPGGRGKRNSAAKSAGGTAKQPAIRTVSCVWCGTTAEGVPLDWTTQTSERGRGLEHLCPACARNNVRSIEARLDSDWW